MKRKFKNIFLAGALLLALFAVLFSFIVFTPYGSGESVTFKVTEGESLEVISDRLAEEGFIKSRFSFWIFSVITGRARSLKAGEYEFFKPVSIYKISSVLNNGGGIDEVEVVLPEGFTLKQIEERMLKEELAGAKGVSTTKVFNWKDDFSFLKSAPDHNTLEGFLFPDTYRFKKHDTTEIVLRKLLNNFNNKVKDLKVTNDDFYKVVILASILEKEVPHRDMKIVSGILQKRLNVNMALQVDASLVYALERPIKRSDIEKLNSAYNTYKYTGLPPTPISNPGLKAIEAALEPIGSDYWYYLSRQDTGETIFSKTLEEHNKARVKYLK